jgi:hypothetical protein
LVGVFGGVEEYLLLGLVVDDLLGVDGENGDLFGFVGFVS